MVESFEFYDLTPILIEEKNKDRHEVQNSDQDIELVNLLPEFVRSFDHVLYW